MILSDGEIKKSINANEIQITGHPEIYIGPSSVDLHLDNYAYIMDDNTTDTISVTQEVDKRFKRHNNWDGIIIFPGKFYLLSTVEKLKFPDDVVGFIQGRSSIARLGINVHAAGFFDAGFEGTATLEVTNLTRIPILIPKDTRICQMVFARTKEKSEIPYSKKKDSKYQQQKGPTITRIHNDYKKNDQ